ncbi:MAG: hypothetical protein WCA26_00655, partial [Xanthobacteraceae bacterium]
APLITPVLWRKRHKNAPAKRLWKGRGEGNRGTEILRHFNLAFILRRNNGRNPHRHNAVGGFQRLLAAASGSGFLGSGNRRSWYRSLFKACPFLNERY